MFDKVIDEIVENNIWRNGEFAKFKINSNQVDEVLWCRMCIPMIYAHWEGFVVSSMKTLISYLYSLNLKAEHVPTKIIVLSLGGAYQALSGKQSFTQRIEFTDKFNNLISDTIKIEKKINTKSNLKSNVFEEVCTIWGFNYTKFNNVLPDIDRLVNIRNSIAHGENGILPNMDNIRKYIEAVNNACDLILEEIECFIKNEEYKK